MDFVRQTIDGAELNRIINLPPMLRNTQVEVIVLPIVTAESVNVNNAKRPIGFARGAEVPDSFFEPMSEEELQLWET